MTESELVYINKLKEQLTIADDLIMRSAILHFEALSDSSNSIFEKYKVVCKRFEDEVNDWFNTTKIKLLIIVGTRPEIIRLAAVINKCREFLDMIFAHIGGTMTENSMA